MHRLLILAAMGAALAGCTRQAPAPSTSGVSQLAPDTYGVTIRADRAVGGIPGAESEALQEANNYCRASAREILVLNRGLDRGRVYRVTFRCLLPGDPELQRPSAEQLAPARRR